MKDVLRWLACAALVLWAVIVFGLPRQRPPVLVVFRSAVITDHLVRVVEETMRRHAPGSQVRVVGHVYPVGRADIVNLVRRIVRETAPMAVVDLGSSNEALVASPVLAEAGIPHLLPMATGENLHRPSPTRFLLLPTDSVQGAFLARVAAGLGLERLLFFYQDAEHGIGVRNGFLPEARAHGATVLASVPYTYIGDPGTIVEAALTRGAPEGVVLVGYPRTGSAMAAQLRRRLPRAPILGSDGLGSNPDLLADVLGPGRRSLYWASFWSRATSKTCARGFPRWLDTVAPEATGSGGLVHDAVAPVAEAVGEGRRSPEEIVEYLQSLGMTRSPFPGVTGPVAYGVGEYPEPHLVGFAVAAAEPPRAGEGRP